MDKLRIDYKAIKAVFEIDEKTKIVLALHRKKESYMYMLLKKSIFGGWVTKKMVFSALVNNDLEEAKKYLLG